MTQKKTAKKTVKTTTVSKKPLEALVFIETKGRTANIASLDIMPKTSEVNFVNRIKIGSGLLTVIYEGEVAAAESAAEAAKSLTAGMSTVMNVNVIPRPHKRIYELIQQKSAQIKDSSDISGLAIGIVETNGFVSMIAAADAGIKSADVEIPSWVTVGSGLSAVIFRGTVAAVHSAVESGSEAASKVGTVAAMHVIPRPHKGTEEVSPVGGFSGDSVLKKVSADSALGVVETRGVTGLIEAIDAGLKAASISVQGWEKIGGGMTSTLFRGNVADVKSSVETAISSAEKVGNVLGSYIIARPHQELEKGR